MVFLLPGFDLGVSQFYLIILLLSSQVRYRNSVGRGGRPLSDLVAAWSLPNVWQYSSCGAHESTCQPTEDTLRLEADIYAWELLAQTLVHQAALASPRNLEACGICFSRRSLRGFTETFSMYDVLTG